MSFSPMYDMQLMMINIASTAEEVVGQKCDMHRSVKMVHPCEYGAVRWCSLLKLQYVR